MILRDLIQSPKKRGRASNAIAYSVNTLRARLWACVELDKLFASLQSRAFGGEV